MLKITSNIFNLFCYLRLKLNGKENNVTSYKQAVFNTCFIISSVKS